jgi:DNA (cytosine-5)-methyltransferase 1
MKQEQCTSLPVTEEGSLPTLSLDTNPQLQLSGMPMPAKSSENGQQTDGSPVCECGKGTFNCLIHPNTPEKWTAFMQDSLAKTLALLENRQAYMREPDQVFTEKSCGSLAWYDQSSSSWKTYQQSLVTDWEPYSETWPRWGMTQGGSAYAHPMSERRITETDGLHWPTPDTRGFVNEGNLSMLAKMCDNKEEMFAMGHRAAASKKEKFWPTPRANTAMASTITPESAWDSKRFPNLETMVGRQMWPTPTAHNAKETNAPSEANRNTPTLAAQVGGKLSPLWVEWLMGFPTGFTASKDWVTPKSRFKQP